MWKCSAWLPGFRLGLQYSLCFNWFRAELNFTPSVPWWDRTGSLKFNKDEELWRMRPNNAKPCCVKETWPWNMYESQSQCHNQENTICKECQQVWECKLIWSYEAAKTMFRSLSIQIRFRILMSQFRFIKKWFAQNGGWARNPYWLEVAVWRLDPANVSLLDFCLNVKSGIFELTNRNYQQFQLKEEYEETMTGN
jgi:hypothetical protein